MAERRVFAGPAVRKVRREAGMTQAAMAEALDISPSYLNLIEHGQRPLSATVIVRLAERFGRPILTFVDTPGAYPGLDAEERGQAEAIARNLIEMAELRVPIVVTVTGEGGSGGALALGVGDRILMLEYSVYSVISPEGCAAILWKDQEKRAQAAEAMRVTAPDLAELGVIDEIVPEPLGAAHSDPQAAARAVGDAIERALVAVERVPIDRLLAERYAKFRALGAVQSA